MDSWRRLTPNQLRARRHVVYSWLIEHWLKPATGGLYHSPTEVIEIILSYDASETFDFDLRGVPGFFFPHSRNYWQLNTKPGTYLEPYTGEGRMVSGFRVLKGPLDTKPLYLTSKGLPLGTEAVKPA